MAERVILHIGAPKCGTTYRPSWANEPRLAEVGVLVPGDWMWHHNRAATRARMENPRPRLRKLWERLVDEVRAHPGTAIFSNEWFTMAGAEGAARTLAAFDDAEVHVVLTARDLGGLVPAAWQEQLKLGHGRCPTSSNASTTSTRTSVGPGARWTPPRCFRAGTCRPAGCTW